MKTYSSINQIRTNNDLKLNAVQQELVHAMQRISTLNNKKISFQVAEECIELETKVKFNRFWSIFYLQQIFTATQTKFHCNSNKM
jgi:hypothetical protein